MSRSGNGRMRPGSVTGGLLHRSAAGLLAALLGAGCAGVPADRQPVSQPPPSARQVFLQACSNCHEAAVAYPHLADRDRWIRLVASMASRDIATVNAATMKVIIMYIDEHPAIVADLFRRQCQSCHPSYSTLKALEKTKAQWKTMITFMGQRSGEGLTADEAEMLLHALGG